MKKQRIIKLWSIQTLTAFQILRKTGRLFGDGRRVDEEYRIAYRWMSDRMRERGIPMHRNYPVWAWYRFDGTHRIPDLRKTNHLLSASKGVRLHINTPRRLVLLSDFNDWHDVLNDWPTTISDTDWDRFQRMNPNSKRYLKCKMESWNQILEFENNPVSSDSHFSNKASIQAVIPYLDISWITKIDFFTAR